MSLAGSIITSLGLVLQKYSWNKGEGESSLFFRWRWWLGFFVLVIGAGSLEAWALGDCLFVWSNVLFPPFHGQLFLNVFIFFSAFAPLRLIAPLSGITIVTNSLTAMYFLGERVELNAMLCMLVIMMGTMLAAVCGSSHSTNHNTEELEALFNNWYLVPYYCPMLLILFISIFLVNFGTWERLRRRDGFFEVLLYANMAGLMGGNQNLFLKCFMELLDESLRTGGTNQFDRSFVYAMLARVVVLGVGQLSFMNLGLSRHRAVIFLPIYR